MDNQNLVDGWQKAIIADAVHKLGRDLTEQERRFITNRGGFIALEIIHDTIKSSGKEYIEHYLNSEP